MRRPFAALALCSFSLAAILGRQFTDILNGSLIYAPAFLVLAGLGSFHYLNRKEERYVVLLSSGFFVFAVFFRSIDLAVCSHIPIGTHFLWHLLNGVVLYLAMRGLVLNYARAGVPRADPRS